MKIKTALISIVVSASLIAGGVFGARYVMSSRKKPVEVVPVSNVNTGYWGMTNSLYGVITSQVAQRVILNEEYPIADIYVEAGQYVEEGTPLFSYDMTLPELELELEELSLLSLELTMKLLEKDLQKLNRTSGSAALYGNDSVLTASAEEEVIIAETMPEETDPNEEGQNITSTEASVSEEGVDSDEGLSIEGIELAADPELAVGVQESVTSFEQLVKAIDVLFQAYGDELRAEEVAESIDAAVEYCRKHLTEKVVTQVQLEDGSVKDHIAYELLDAVKQELEGTELEELKACISLLDRYQASYVEMLLEEAEALQGEELKEAAAEVREQYEYLSTEVQEKAGLLFAVEALELQVQQIEDNSETESEIESESESESESETETESETASESETESESETASESETKSKSKTASESEPEPETETNHESETSEIETESDSETETEIPLDLNVYINNFRDMSDALLRNEAAAEEGYLTQLGTAVSFYQEWLAVPREDIPDGYVVHPTMESYTLKESVRELLRAAGEDHLMQEMEESYQEICFRYVRESILKLDPMALVREQFEEVRTLYNTIGTGWQAELETRWMTEQEASQNQSETDISDEQFDGENQTQEAALLTLGQILDAYEVILLIQELDPAGDEITLMLALEEAQDTYKALNDSQRQLVWNYNVLEELLKQYGLYEKETESEYDDDDWEDDWGDDWGGYGDDYAYTAEELAMMIADKKQEIKDCELDIREAEIAVRTRERIVEKKVVKSTLAGTVVSIGSEDGSSDGEYFAIITNETGLYAKGCINELALETIKVGDTISGMSYDTGMSFTAVIKEIDDYPDPEGNNMSYGAENPNASYYPFYALIDNPEDVEEGDVEIQLSDSMTNMYDAIYLENYFVRTGNDGKPYVFMKGEDGKLKKQQVVTGRRISGYAVEIVAGLTPDDLIAFPYGKDVVEGAATKEVDMLEAAYM